MCDFNSRIRYFDINDELIIVISLEFMCRNASYNEMSKMRKFNIKARLICDNKIKVIRGKDRGDRSKAVSY